MLILAILAPTVRQADTNELVAIEPLSWLGSQRAGLNNQARATVFCLQLEMLDFELFSWYILNWGKQVGWNCRSSVYFAVGARHHPGCFSTGVYLISCEPHGAFVVFVYASSALVWPWCEQLVCSIDVQVVNGHYKKVTEWGRKDSIYRHSPWSWRWTTMVSFLPFPLHID